MPKAQIVERADEVAHRLVRVYEIHEIIIAETGGLPGLRDAATLHVFRLRKRTHAIHKAKTLNLGASVRSLFGSNSCWAFGRLVG